MKDDLISRQATIDALGERPKIFVGGDYELGSANQYDIDRLAIETVPSADAVEVVRCKDCKWWDNCPSSSAAPKYHECHYGAAHRHTTANDYCSYGVRKDD